MPYLRFSVNLSVLETCYCSNIHLSWCPETDVLLYFSPPSLPDCMYYVDLFDRVVVNERINSISKKGLFKDYKQTALIYNYVVNSQRKFNLIRF